MRYYKIIFSPTGGTQKVADAITASWPEVETIDLSENTTDYSKISLGGDSLALIAMPSFGGLAPQVALDRLAKLKADQALCAVVAVYGNRDYDDTLVQMEDYAKAAGFQVIGGVSAVAEHSIAHQYATGRPNAKDAAQLKGFGEQILARAQAGQADTPAFPGNRPYKKAGAGMVPKAGSGCTSCGLCAKMCPTGAISAANPKTCDKDKCANCMRCVSICPAHARKVSGLMTAVVGMALKKACSVEKGNELF